MREVHGVSKRSPTDGAEIKISARESGGGIITVSIRHIECGLNVDEARYLASRLRRMARRINTGEAQ